MKKIILLDRDGVINYDSLNYIRTVDEFIFIPGSINAIVRLTQAGYRIGIATNQSGIARGYYNAQDLAAIHTKMYQAIHAAGGEIEAIEYCPHHPDEGCLCRKPRGGMLLTLGLRFNTSLTGIPFLGDKISDIQAAQVVGGVAVLIAEKDSPVDQLRQQNYPNVPRFNSLADYVDTIL